MIVIKRFTASWCAPCKTLAPIMENVKPNFPNAQFEVIDVDENQSIAGQYGIRNIPTVIVEKDGTEITRFTGVRQEHQIIQSINESI